MRPEWIPGSSPPKRTPSCEHEATPNAPSARRRICEANWGTTVRQYRLFAAVAKSVAVRYPELAHDDLILLVDGLWSAFAHESRMAAVELLKLYLDRLQPDDISLLEQLLRESRT